MTPIDKRLNFVGIRLTDAERCELDALKQAFDLGDSMILRAALQLLARVTVGGQVRQGGP